MFRLIAITLALCGLLISVPGAAEAHAIVYNDYDSPRHYHGNIPRDHAMPRWLWKKKGFRHWYHRSAQRLNYRLAWWQIYDIYRWERRFSHPRHYHSDYGARHREYDWYKRYWRDHDRRLRSTSRHHEYRDKKRRRHRDH